MSLLWGRIEQKRSGICLLDCVSVCFLYINIVKFGFCYDEHV